MNARAAALTAALSFVGTPTRAADIQPPLTDYLLTSWGDRDGVPIGTVYAIAQDQAGYLWLGTDGGLVRFDGFRFSPTDQFVRGSLPKTGVVALCAAADGTLLVGFATGEVRRIQGDAVQAAGPAEPAQGLIDALVQDRAGTIWAVAQGRVHRQHQHGWETVPIDTPDARAVNAYVGPGGTLYVATSRGAYRHERDGTFHRLSTDFVYSVSENRGGEVWVTHPAYGFVRASDSSHDDARLGNGYRAIHDQDGNLWVATIGKGLWRVQLNAAGGQDWIEIAPVPTLPGDSAQALFEDRERNIWIGTPTGLHRLTRKPLTPVANAGPILSTEATANGTGIWAGTMFDGLIRFSRAGDTWQRTVHSDPDVMVRSLHRDSAGDLWIGTNRGLGRLQNDRLVLLPGTRDAAPVFWLTSDQEGTLWLGDRRRLFRFAGGRLSEVTLTANRAVTFAQGDGKGQLWVAFRDGTLGVIDPQGQFRDVQHGASAAANRSVYCIYEDSRGIVWFGASDGLHRYADGRFSIVRLSSEWPGNQVWAIVEDDQRFLWLNTDLGVLRIHPDELARAAADARYRMRYQFFNGNDGLAGASVEYLRAARGSDSTLWFARGGALTAVDPHMLRANGSRPLNAVRIEQVSTEQGPFNISAGRTLAAGTRRLDVIFSVLHLSPTPRLRFRHRLEGFDSDWREAGTRLVASYTNLSPGSYRLVVEAYSTEGTFGRAGTWAFEVPPTLSQTRTFRIGAMLALALLVAVAWWLRTRIVHRQFAAVLAERARVSREIHDTLLQGVVGIALQLNHLEHSAPESSDNARRFERMRLQLEAYVRDARQSILDLRSPVLERRTFEQAFQEMGARLTEGTGIDFSVRVKGKPRECPARMENELLRIGHEAIANAVRHARASSIEVELRFEEASVVLRVTDNGCGFDLEHAMSSHTQFGLVSMQERARTLGGQLKVVTSVQRGTNVEAVFPMRATA